MDWAAEGSGDRRMKRRKKRRWGILSPCSAAAFDMAAVRGVSFGGDERKRREA